LGKLIHKGGSRRMRDMNPILRNQLSIILLL
jgi:hypothetical protein